MPGAPARPREALLVLFVPSLRAVYVLVTYVCRDALVDDHLALHGQAVAVEGQRAVAAQAGLEHHGAVIDHGDQRARDLQAQHVFKHGGVAIHRVAIDRAEDVADDAARNFA